MKVSIATSLAVLAQQVASHATFQNLWVDGKDQHGMTCARTPINNTPLTVVTTPDIRCNVGGAKGVAAKCSVAAGQKVAIEMHQQMGDRNCKSESIGGAHYGPVQAYMSKVSDAASADGSAGWFKIMSNGWSAKSGSSVGDNDNWGTNDLNKCCGRMEFPIPADIPAGDYLLRAEAIALHSPPGQFYITCYQLTVTGGGSTAPATVNLPGAYTANDPGIVAKIHQKMTSYTPPGPAVISSGKTIVPGNPTCPAGTPKTAFTFDA